MPSANSAYLLNASAEIVCLNCGKKFVETGKRAGVAKYCSHNCYIGHRWHGKGKCNYCGKKTAKRYCSSDCQKAYWLEREPERNDKRRRAYWNRKLAIVKKLGGRCVSCGNEDIRVLDIDHIDPSKKNKPAHRNYPTCIRVNLWEKEMDNLQLLCANCHRIKTHEETWKTEGYI